MALNFLDDAPTKVRFLDDEDRASSEIVPTQDYGGAGAPAAPELPEAPPEVARAALSVNQTVDDFRFMNSIPSRLDWSGALTEGEARSQRKRKEDAAAKANPAIDFTKLDKVAGDLPFNETWGDAAGNAITETGNAIGGVLKAITTGGGSVIYGDALRENRNPEKANRILGKAFYDKDPEAIKMASDNMGVDLTDPAIFQRAADQYKMDASRNIKPTAILSNGAIWVSPKLALDEAEYLKAVDAAGSGDAKQVAAAKGRFEALREQAATDLLPVLREQGAFVKYEAKHGGKHISDGQLVQNYNRQIGIPSKIFNTIALGTEGGLAQLSQSIYGLAGMAGSDAALKVAQGMGQEASNMSRLGEATGTPVFPQKVVAAVPSLLPYVATGGVAGAAGASARVAMAAQLGTGFAHVAGSSFPDAYGRLIDQGVPESEARWRATGEAVVDGLITGATMKYIGGAEKAMSNLARGKAASTAKGYVGAIARTGGEEFAQESAEEYGQALNALGGSNKGGSSLQAFEQGLEGGAIGAVLGGGVGALTHAATDGNRRAVANYRAILFPEGATAVEINGQPIHTATTSEFFEALLDRKAALEAKDKLTFSEKDELRQLNYADEYLDGGNPKRRDAFIKAKAKAAGVQLVRNTDRANFEEEMQAEAERIRAIAPAERTKEDAATLKMLESQTLEVVAALLGRRLRDSGQAQGQRPIDVKVEPPPTPEPEINTTPIDGKGDASPLYEAGADKNLSAIEVTTKTVTATGSSGGSTTFATEAEAAQHIAQQRAKNPNVVITVKGMDQVGLNKAEVAKAVERLNAEPVAAPTAEKPAPDEGKFFNVSFSPEKNQYVIEPSDSPVSRVVFLDPEKGRVYSGSNHGEIQEAVRINENRILKADGKTNGFYIDGKYVDRTPERNETDLSEYKIKPPSEPKPASPAPENLPPKVETAIREVEAKPSDIPAPVVSEPAKPEPAPVAKDEPARDVSNVEALTGEAAMTFPKWMNQGRIQSELSNTPEVAQPTFNKSVKISTETMSGPKDVRGREVLLPGYKGARLVVAEYKAPKGRAQEKGYRIYFRDSGALIQDSNGVSSLSDTLKQAVGRINSEMKGRGLQSSYELVHAQIVERAKRGKAASIRPPVAPPAPEPAAPAPPEPVKPAKGDFALEPQAVNKPRGRRKKSDLPPAPGGHDIIDEILDNHGKIQSRGAARKNKLKAAGKSPFTKTEMGGEHDGWSNLPPALRKALFDFTGGGIAPDVMADNVLKGEKMGDTGALLDAIQAAWKARIAHREEGKQQSRLAKANAPEIKRMKKQEAAFDKAALEPKDAAAFPVDPKAVNVGDKIVIDGDAMEVIAVDKQEGSFTLEGGERFGTQTVHSDKTIYGDHIKAKKAPAKKQSAELLGDETPFNLTAESAEEKAKREAAIEADAKAKADEQAAKDKAEQDKLQGDMFSQQSIADTAPAHPLTTSQVKRAIAPLVARFKGAVETVVVADGSQFPDAVKAAAKAKGIDLNRIGGAVYDGKVYLNAAGLNSTARAAEVFFHEQAGHMGVDGMLDALSPKSSARLLAALEREFPAEFAYVAKRYGPKSQLSETLARIMEKFGPKSDSTPKDQSRWRRILDFIRTILAKSGIKRWTKNDIEALLRRGIDKVRAGDGKADKRDSVKFSIDGDEDTQEDVDDGGIEHSTMDKYQESEVRVFPSLNKEGVKAAAMAAMEKDPNLADAIIARLNGPVSIDHSVTLKEEAILQVHAITLLNRRNAQQLIVNNTKLSSNERATAMAALENIAHEMERLDNATEASGALWSRFGNYRQTVLKGDYSFKSLKAQALSQKRKGGDEDAELTKEEIDRLRGIAADYERIQKELDERVEKLTDEEKARIAQERFDALAYRSIPERVLEQARAWDKELLDKGAAADAVLDAVFAEMDDAGEFVKFAINEGEGSTPKADSEADILQKKERREKILSALADKAAVEMRFGNFDNFSADIFDKYGSAFSPAFVKEAWALGKKRYENLGGKKATKIVKKNKGKAPASDSTTRTKAKALAKNDLDSIKAGIEEIAEDPTALENLSTLKKYVRIMADKAVEAGATSVEDVVKQLQEFFTPLLPEGTTISDMQFKEYWSAYGEGKAATTVAIEMLKKQLKYEALLEKKLEVTKRKERTKITGNQRVAPTDNARRLTKEINEAKKLIPETDEEAKKRGEARNKSSLDAMETRLKNQIADLRFEIGQGVRTLKRKNLPPTSPRIEKLRAELAQVQSDHLAIFGKRQMTEEQKQKAAIAAAERAEKRAEAELSAAKKGQFSTPLKRGQSRYAAVLAIQARTEAARAETKMLRDMDSALAETKKQKELEAEIERLEKTLGEGKFAPESKEPGAPTADTEAVTNLKAKRDALAAELAKKRKAARPVPDAELRELKRLENELARLIKGRAKPQKKMTVDTEQQAFAREQLAAKRAELAEIRANDDILNIARRKAAMLRSLAALQQRMKDGNFDPTPRKQPTDLSSDPEAVALELELAKTRAEFDALKKKMEIANMNPIQRAGHEALRLWDASRNVFLSLDISAMLQTAFAAAAHPIEGAKALGKGVKALLFTTWSNEYAKKLEMQERAEPLFMDGTLKKMGVDVGSMQSHGVENIGSDLDRLADLEARWQSIPDVIKGLFGLNGQKLVKGLGGVGKLAVKGLARPFKASNVAFAAISHHMRLVMAKSLLERHYRNQPPPTKQQLEILGGFVNTATGKGFKGGGMGDKAIHLFLFAPNYYLSIAKSFIGYDALKALAKLEGKAAANIITEYLRATITMAMVWAMSRLFGDDDDDEMWNPLAQNYGKFSTKNGTLIDLTMGRGTYISTVWQALQGEKHVNGTVIDVNGYSHIWNFLKYRGSREFKTGIPAVTALVRWITGNEKPVEDIMGKEITPAGQVYEAVAPLGWREWKNLVEAEGMTTGSALQLLNLMGITSKVPKE